jgi:hypothetical protein
MSRNRMSIAQKCGDCKEEEEENERIMKIK